MRRSLLKYASLYNLNRNSSPQIIKSNPNFSLLPLSTTPNFISRFFSSENNSSSNQNPNPETNSDLPGEKPETPVEVEDVDTEEFKRRIQEYFNGKEEMLPSVAEAIFKRILSNKHEETDDELMEELRLKPRKPLDNVTDKDFDDGLDEVETNEEISDLYSPMDYVKQKMVKEEYFDMDEHKWDEFVKEGVEHGALRDTRECEDILLSMLHWDKILPDEERRRREAGDGGIVIRPYFPIIPQQKADEIKKKIEAKHNELEEMIEKQEILPDKAYELFKEFEDEMVIECAKILDEEQPPSDDDETDTVLNLKDFDDPPGEGPILWWQTRVVLGPGGDAWHPKNRKVKLSVTVKELELSKHAFRRLRELVGKRYHPGKDHLTITSERFEHREENRKDCLRTLYSLIEEAMKADKLVEEAQASYLKEKLRASPKFMERLQAKTMLMRNSSTAALPS
ncbi:hypothetical protein GIB67_004600 [Kingdonia uniflora]|uniref:Small ribosomal subunit protein mS35 mitochondrial conserved domain-containing protein n=1 Tax=Kingdonia uniflora TaxID=39325 RepID=A0A7J7MD17_9MAGN|nr:hypothetical protein GIB67_004600 [Kingdonia uniflora]